MEKPKLEKYITWFDSQSDKYYLVNITNNNDYLIEKQQVFRKGQLQERCELYNKYYNDEYNFSNDYPEESKLFYDNYESISSKYKDSEYGSFNNIFNKWLFNWCFEEILKESD